MGRSTDLNVEVVTAVHTLYNCLYKHTENFREMSRENRRIAPSESKFTDLMPTVSLNLWEKEKETSAF